MKAFKKVLCLFLALLISVSVAHNVFTMGATAFTVSSNELFLDFNDSKGVANATATALFTTEAEDLNGLEQYGYSFVADPDDKNNTCLHMWNRVYNGFSVMLGTPGCDISEDNAFELKPSTTYTLKLKYKYQAGSSIVGNNADKTGFTNTLRFELYSGTQVAYSSSMPKKSLSFLGKMDIDAMSQDKYIATEPQRNFEYNVETNNTVPETYTRRILAEDTAWQTAEYTFTTKSDITNQENLFLTLSAGNNSISGGGWDQTDIYQYLGVYFDDVSITKVDKNLTAGEFVYDFKSNGQSDYADASQYWFSNCATDVYNIGEKGSFVSNDGMQFTSTVGGRHDGTAEWLHRVALRDNDINLGDDKGLLKLEANTEYTVIVKYKPLNIAANNSKFGVAVSVPGNGTTYNSMTLGVTQHMIATLKSKLFTAAESDWQYMSVVIDGDAETVAGTANAGAYVYLTATGSAEKPSTYLIESVKVLVVKKGTSPAILKRLIRGEIFDVALVKGGETLTPPPMSKGETSFGWVNSKGEYVTTAPDTSETLNAAYPTNIYTFDNGMNDIFMPNASNLGMKLNVVEDPLLGKGNNVLKMNCTQTDGSTNNFCLSALVGANNEGFKVNGGSTYQITMDVYLESSNVAAGTNNFLLTWLAAKGGVSHTGGKDSSGTKIPSEQRSKMAGSTEAKKWVTLIFEYTPSASKVQSYPYMLIAYTYGKRANAEADNAVIYFDNITITEKSSAENKGASVMLDPMGGSVDTYKIMAKNGEQIKLPTPKKDGYLFSGWTSSLEMAQGTLKNSKENLKDSIAPKTVVVGNGCETYYAIWTKKTTDYTFGSPNSTVFQSYLKTEEVTSSGGNVSVGYSLYDEDGDGNYELKGDQTSRDPSSYKVNLGLRSDGKDVFYNLREDVTYRITMKFKVDALQDGVARIGVGRCLQNGFGICKMTGGDKYDYNEFYTAVAVTNGYITVTKEYTCKGIFDISLNGTTGSSGSVSYYKDALFVTIGQGRVYVKSITVEAVSYGHQLTKVTGNGKISVDYGNKTVEVIPDNGYMLKPGSLKMNYTRHFFDSEKYGGQYDHTKPEHVEAVTELDGYSQSIFKLYETKFGKNNYSFVNPYAYSPDGMVIYAEFVPITEVSAGIMASSIRYEKTDGDKYQSAGLRFRARVVDDARITEVGFIVVPTELKKSLDELRFNQDGSINCVNAIKAVAFSKGVNKQYEKGNGYTDYQVLIKDLTDKNGRVDMTDVDFTVVVYAKYDDNGSQSIAYSEEFSASWKSVNMKYEKLK